MIRLYPSVERYLDRPGAAEWPTLPFDAPAHVRLHADMSELAIGSVMATFARYNTAADAHGSIADHELLTLALERERLLLPGGVVATDDASGIEVAPGCCAGLEQWHEWTDFLVDGQSPWLGHDPSPFLESVGGNVDICCEQGEPTVSVRLTLSLADFTQELAAVESHLRAFSPQARKWADEMIPSHAARLIARWESAFGPASGRR